MDRKYLDKILSKKQQAMKFYLHYCQNYVRKIILKGDQYIDMMPLYGRMMDDFFF